MIVDSSVAIGSVRLRVVVKTLSDPLTAFLRRGCLLVLVMLGAEQSGLGEVLGEDCVSEPWPPQRCPRTEVVVAQ